MAYREIAMSLALVLVSMLWAGAMAQSSCTNALISMSPCLNYITGNSSTPSSQCCSQLASVVRSSPQCLCQVLNGGGSSLGININQTQALALPSACNVQTPPVSRCNGKIFSFSILTCMRTAASPAASPETPGTAEVPTTPSGTGSKTVPSTEGDGTSDGNSIKLSISLLTVLLFAASYGSTFTSC